MSAHDQIIEQLQRLTMSGYEARAYVALVAAGKPLNGYEVAKQSGVPRSTVYETLSKLVSRGAVFEVATEGGNSFLPLPVDTLLARLRRDFDHSATAISEALPSVVSAPPAQLLHHIRDRAGVLERASDLIAGAKSDLVLSLWDEELADLRPLIQQAEARGVGIFLLAFGEKQDPAESPHYTYHHHFLCPETVLDRVGYRQLVIAADGNSVVIGGAVGDDTWGIYSDDPAVVLLAIEFVRHDIGFQVLAEKFGLREATDLFRIDDALYRLATGQGAPATPRKAPSKTKAKASTNGAAKPRRRSAPPKKRQQPV